MTDAELKDAALVKFAEELTYLMLTTRGLKGFSPPSSAAWSKALKARAEGLALLAQIGQAPPPPPPLTGGTVIPANGLISSGGVWYGDPFVGTVKITATSPVTITGEVRNVTGQPLIDAVGAGAVNVTLDRLKALGGATYQTSGRLFQAYGFKSFEARSCTITNTRGIELSVAAPGASVLISKVRHKNIQGGPDASPVGNFVQFRVCRDMKALVEWVEVVNEYGLSEPEDIISVYHSSNVEIRDFMLRHQSRIGNLTPSSQGSITIDASDAGPGCDNVYVHDGQIIDAYGIIAYSGAAACRDILIENNRILADRLLPNGQNKANGYGNPLVIKPGGSGNHAHGNVVGYIDAGGAQTFCDLSGAVEGHAAEAAKNTQLPLSQISPVAEDAEWQRWLDKLAANGVVIAV